ncbi:MAG: sulfatase-like hydrolase/transferase [Verrucomicrobia bacterium]|nr:sulfatase-like hydrolase/transferase [Verrucomicrobiota bacterium]
MLSAAPPPNIVFILADDLGYGELGSYGQEKIKTPHLDQLARDGLRFTRHYTGAAVCAPARCTLLTGRHLGHAEIRNNGDSGNGRPFPGQWPLSAGAITIAKTLKSADYATGGFGKWGLGPSDSTGGPNNQGFDRFYLPFVEPHLSMQPPQDWINRYPEDWDKDNGPYRGQNGYLPHPRPRAGYAAMISDLDEHVGTILKRLDDLGLRNNTLVIFTSDNGTTHPGNDPKFHIGGVDAPFFNSVAGLRGWKGALYEGGIRVPAIVRWPGKVKPGTTTDTPSYFPDWFPTLCQATGAKAPAALDGDDLTPLLTATADFKRHKPMVWEFHGYGTQLAVIDGPWKAIRQNVKSKTPGPWELYNLSEDPAETNDLAAQHPDLLQRLTNISATDRTPNPRAKLPLYDNK